LAGPVYFQKNEELARNCLDVASKAEVTVLVLRRKGRRSTNTFWETIMASKKTKTTKPSHRAKGVVDITTADALPTAAPGDVLQEASAKESAVTRAKKPAKTAAKGDKAQPKPTAQRDKKLSALDAAAKVLQEAGTPLNCQDMIAAMAAKGYWSSPAGKTPASTLYSALLREIKTKGKQARFQKAARGQFVYQTPLAS
jgi:HB1, ASXL, restriction endonuclease HTH domain